MERAIQTVQDQIRTMKSALDGKIAEEVNPDHPGPPRRVMHSARRPNDAGWIERVTSKHALWRNDKFYPQRYLKPEG